MAAGRFRAERWGPRSRANALSLGRARRRGPAPSPSVPGRCPGARAPSVRARTSAPRPGAEGGRWPHRGGRYGGSRGSRHPAVLEPRRADFFLVVVQASSPGTWAARGFGWKLRAPSARGSRSPAHRRGPPRALGEHVQPHAGLGRPGVSDRAPHPVM